MDRHLKSGNTFVYQLVLLTSLLFSAEKGRNITADYAEYLREQPEKPESPWQFCAAIMRREDKYHPKTRTVLAVLAAALLITAGLWVGNFVSLSFLAVGLPITVWMAIGGSKAVRCSPPYLHAARCVLLPFLAIALLAAGFFLVFHAAVSESFFITPRMAWIITKGRWICSAASLLLFLVSACLLWRRSIWYFCPLVQSVSAWCFFRGIYNIMTSLVDASVIFSISEHFDCFIPLALGLTLSLAFALYIRNRERAMNRHSTSRKKLVYQLVLLTSILSPAEKVRDITADYTEYLREQSEKPDSPWQFCSSIMRAEPGYRPKAKTLLAIPAAAILFFIGIQVDPVPLSILAAGLPVALWVAIDGSTTARYSPPHPHAARWVLLPVLATALLSAGAFHIIHTVVAEPLRLTPVMRVLIRWGPRLCSTASLLLFLVSARMLWRSSIWYFCPLVQSVSAWCFFRGINFIFHIMEINDSTWPLQYFFHFLTPLVLGLTVSLVFALILWKITGKENMQWTDR